MLFGPMEGLFAEFNARSSMKNKDRSSIQSRNSRLVEIQDAFEKAAYAVMLIDKDTPEYVAIACLDNIRSVTAIFKDYIMNSNEKDD